jgi:hypothetical protein
MILFSSPIMAHLKYVKDCHHTSGRHVFLKITFLYADTKMAYYFVNLLERNKTNSLLTSQWGVNSVFNQFLFFPFTTFF